MTRPYLEHIKITAFGAFSNKAVGPFASGLNVVIGRNEAGKTTVASFVGGVLFGWEEARGVRNTYKPENAERSGSLFFSLPDGEAELSRTRNADGLQGDASLVADLDRETFKTMFSLTSDELRTLRNTTDVTAKLLTAGSGTGASPAHARALVQERLAEYTSRASGVGHSLTNLAARRDRLLAELSAASDRAERLKREDKEFRDLAPQRDELLARLDALNSEIEALTAHRANAEKLDAELEALEERIAELRDEEEDLRAQRRLREDAALSQLIRLEASEERALRDRLEALAVDEAKCDHAVDLARTTSPRRKRLTRPCSKRRTTPRRRACCAAREACRWRFPSLCRSSSCSRACPCSCMGARSTACRSRWAASGWWSSPSSWPWRRSSCCFGPTRRPTRRRPACAMPSG